MRSDLNAAGGNGFGLGFCQNILINHEGRRELRLEGRTGEAMGKFLHLAASRLVSFYFWSRSRVVWSMR